MPELPEVETIKRGLLAKAKGKKIKGVEVRIPKVFIGNKKKIIGTKIEDVKRTGKILQIILDNNYSILIHLKMTGQLIYQKSQPKAGPPGAENIKNQKYIGGYYQKVYQRLLPHKYTHIIYTFTDGSRLYFNDLRKFGWNRIVKISEVGKILGPDKFGPEPGSKNLSFEYFKKILSRSKKTIKQILMDQERISGVGNIYSSEGLFYAGIKPQRPANSLSDREIKKLKKSLERVIELGIKYGGSSENTYVNIKGKKGKYMNIAAVYQGAGEKCKKCGTKIKSQKFSGRTAFWCPRCQR